MTTKDTGRIDTRAVWQSVLADLQFQVSKPVYQTFLSKIDLLSLKNQTARLGCSQPMLISFIEKRYHDLIKKALDSHTDLDIKLIFLPKTTKEGVKKDVDGPLFTIKTNPKRNISSNLRLNPDYTFDNFAVSSSNQMAHAAATAVSKAPGASYNPLFLYGGTGVGKTHLMQAVAHQIIKNTSNTKIIYCTSEEFTNEIIEAISKKKTVSFKKKFRYLDALLIDDIQFIAGKNAVQEEFFHTFNAIQQTKGQIVLTSDRSPEEINKLEERLRSRFEGGLTIDIGQPDFELRCAILLIKAKQRGVDLPIKIVKLLASNIENPRRLEGALIRILTESQTYNLPINEDLVKKTVGKEARSISAEIRTSPEEVIKTVASYFKIKLSQLKGARRDRSLSLPRQILYYLLRTELHLSLVEIGDLLGGRDHTTILYGVRKVNKLYSTNQVIKEDIMGIKNRLFG